MSGMLAIEVFSPCRLADYAEILRPFGLYYPFDLNGTLSPLTSTGKYPGTKENGMNMQNTTNLFPEKHSASNCQNCQTRKLSGSELMECLMEPIRCQWVLPFGNGIFCKHPSAKQFAK